MTQVALRQSVCAGSSRSWERIIAPWRWWIATRVGIQGKIVFAFTFLLIAALGTTSLLFVDQMRTALNDLAGQRAVEVSQTLALASELPLAQRDVTELNRIGNDLLRNRDIITVAFFDAKANPLAIACQNFTYLTDDPSFVPHVKSNIDYMMQVRHKATPGVGMYAQIMAPVRHGSPHQLAGFVVTNIAEGVQSRQLEKVMFILIVVTGLAMVIVLPLISLLVHHIFSPIRQLVSATEQIAGGDLDACVNVNRSDAIGVLARSFNQMVQRVKRQQQDLASANKDLADINQDLESRIRQRTGQLEMANQRLSSEIAEKEDFLRAVSHDLNAPLRNISGMASMLLSKSSSQFDAEALHRLQRIQKNVEVETDLISELLELSRIKSRRQKLETVDLCKMIEELGDMFEDDLKRRNIALVVDTALPLLSAERARIRQVFQNLIDNAIKYMGDEGQTKERAIHVGCTPRDSEAEFYVRDTGIGIDPADIDKVFYIFRRGKSQAVQNIAGKGVGLASVKSIIETYSGRIWVESQLHQGSKFIFTINGKYVGRTESCSQPKN
jgi:signal transduction histidine kinase